MKNQEDPQLANSAGDAHRHSGVVARLMRLVQGCLTLRKRRHLPPRSVLVVGVFLTDQESLISEIVHELGESKHSVVQRWIALGVASPTERISRFVCDHVKKPLPKFVLINRALSGLALQDYDYVMVSDDDIGLPEGFLDRFLETQACCNFGLAQPARSNKSSISHAVTVAWDGFLARRTRFVEIGPLFSVHRSIANLVIPFDESAYMGWGLDRVWAESLDENGAHMGIVDCTPVDHCIRPTACYYSDSLAVRSMREYLRRHRHLTLSKTHEVLTAYRETKLGGDFIFGYCPELRVPRFL